MVLNKYAKPHMHLVVIHGITLAASMRARLA
jgi:hypothetical protein